MTGIRQYLMTIIAGASICAILTNISGKSSANAALIKLLSEIFLLFLIISPLTMLEIPSISDFLADDTMVSGAVFEGESYAQTQSEAIIKESVIAYVLNKADELHAEIEVDVFLSESPPKIPVGIVIGGDVSPYVRTVLQATIAKELGVPKESQTWN